MGNKSKRSAAAAALAVTVQSTSDPGPSKKGLILDTTCLGLGNTSWQSIYNLIEVEELETVPVQATAYSNRKSEASLRDLADSYLQRIAAREKILPYTNVVRWELEEIPVLNRTFFTVDEVFLAHFSLMT